MSDPLDQPSATAATSTVPTAAAAAAPIPTTEPVNPSPPVVATKPAKKQSRGGTMLLAAAGLVAIAGIAFAAGRLTAPAAAASGNGGLRGGFPTGSFAPGGGFPGGFRGANGGGFGGGLGGGLGGAINLRGQVTAVSSTSITIKLTNGSNITVPLDASTTYHQATTGSATDVTVGSTVDVQPGTTNFAPGGSPNPAASQAPGGLGPVTFGPATDVTVVQP